MKHIEQAMKKAGMVISREKRISDPAQLWATRIFCAVAKNKGYSTVDIADYIDKDQFVVDFNIRQINGLIFKTDFISKAILAELQKIC